MNILPYYDKFPKIAEDAFIAEGCQIIGDVEIGSKCGIWFNCVIRGDVAKVKIGQKTNIQDGTVIHVTRGGYDTIIGNGVTIGHKVLLHACILQDYCFIGMNSCLLDESVVETGGMLAAGSLLTKGKIVKKGQIWAGNPAKFFRQMSDEEIEHIKISEQNYTKHAIEYLNYRKTGIFFYE